MNNKIPTTIYLMPGMAASSKIFELIKFPSYYNVIYLKWIKPNKNETIKSYAKRMSKFINDVYPVLIGISFGGILVQEISKHIKVKKLIIISSVKSKIELSLSITLLLFCKLVLGSFFLFFQISILSSAITEKKSKLIINKPKMYLKLFNIICNINFVFFLRTRKIYFFY